MHRILLAAIFLIASGCAKPPSESPKIAQPQVNLHLLQPLVLKEKPAEDAIRTVRDVRQNAENGELVLVRGQVPPEGIKPFLEGMAGFTLMAVEDLQDPAVIEEFNCADAAT